MISPGSANDCSACGRYCTPTVTIAGTTSVTPGSPAWRSAVAAAPAHWLASTGSIRPAAGAVRISTTRQLSPEATMRQSIFCVARDMGNDGLCQWEREGHYHALRRRQRALWGQFDTGTAGNAATEQDLPQGFALWWERARDWSVLLARVAGHPMPGARIDMRRVGVAGFSPGGYPALALAGARICQRRFRVEENRRRHDRATGTQRRVGKALRPVVDAADAAVEYRHRPAAERGNESLDRATGRPACRGLRQSLNRRRRHGTGSMRHFIARK